MSSTEATQSDKYALVSSFYGPGAVVGWYLTALASLISYSLHPRKRGRDSITVDLIAVLTFPAIAAADLINKVRSYPKEGTASAQNVASIEATLIVTETFLAIDVVLISWALGFKCVRRPCLLAILGLFCVSTECYVYFSPFDLGVGQRFDRPFLIDYGGILFGVMAALIICVICALGLVALFFSVHPHEPRARTSEREVGATRKHWEQDFIHSRNAAALTGISFVFLPCTLGATTTLMFSEALVDLPTQFLPWIRTAASRIAHRLIPISNTSIKELDQAAALLAGATVLGFSLYSTADTYYQAWLTKTRGMTQQQGIELRTLNHNQTPNH